MTDIKKTVDEEQPEPYFVDDEGPFDIPHFITCTNAYEMFGMKDGEKVEEAMARYYAKDE